jgi:hypothetical protein
MENNRDDLIVILAGYRDRMETFFQSNPGIKSRIAHHIDFPDFKAEELMGIADLMLQQLMYRFTEPARQTFADYLVRRMSQPHFANARSVRNAIDRIRLRHASRLLGLGRTLERNDLMTIEPEDILKSRVFDEPADHAPPEAPWMRVRAANFVFTLQMGGNHARRCRDTMYLDKLDGGSTALSFDRMRGSVKHQPKPV